MLISVKKLHNDESGESKTDFIKGETVTNGGQLLMFYNIHILNICKFEYAYIH